MFLSFDKIGSLKFFFVVYARTSIIPWCYNLLYRDKFISCGKLWTVDYKEFKTIYSVDVYICILLVLYSVIVFIVSLNNYTVSLLCIQGVSLLLIINLRVAPFPLARNYFATLNNQGSFPPKIENNIPLQVSVPKH